MKVPESLWARLASALFGPHWDVTVEQSIGTSTSCEVVLVVRSRDASTYPPTAILVGSLRSKLEGEAYLHGCDVNVEQEEVTYEQYDADIATLRSLSDEKEAALLVTQEFLRLRVTISARSSLQISNLIATLSSCKTSSRANSTGEVSSELANGAFGYHQPDDGSSYIKSVWLSMLEGGGYGGAMGATAGGLAGLKGGFVVLAAVSAGGLLAPAVACGSVGMLLGATAGWVSGVRGGGTGSVEGTVAACYKNDS